MNTRLVNAAADVICAAQKLDRTPAGIAFALESAQLLQSPETAAELAALRAEVKKLRARVEELVEQRDDALVDLVAEGAAGVDADPIRYTLTTPAEAGDAP